MKDFKDNIEKPKEKITIPCKHNNINGALALRLRG